MQKDNTKKVWKSLIILWFLSIPLSISACDSIFALLIIGAIFNLKSFKELYQFKHIYIFIIALVIISLFSPDAVASLKKSKRFIYFLMIIPIYVFKFTQDDFIKLVTYYIAEMTALVIISISYGSYDVAHRLYLVVNPIHPGLFAALMGSAIIYLCILTKSKKKISINTLLFIILLFGIYKTLSGTVIIAVFVSIFFMVNEIPFIKKNKIIIISTIIIFIIMIFYIRHRYIFRTELFYSTLRIRYYLWKMGFKMLSGHWLFGVGPGNVQNLYGQYAYEWMKNINFDNLHSDYIQFLVEYGILGFAAYTFLVYKTVALFFKSHIFLNKIITVSLIMVFICGLTQLMIFSAQYNRIISFLYCYMIYFNTKDLP